MIRILIVLLFLTLPALISCGEQGTAVFDGDGCEGYTPAAESPYRLPYAVGESYQILQGNCGSVSHHGIARFSYDFEMPVGTDVLAMRAGTVIKVVMNYDEGTYNADYNVVHIRHSDGTIATYVHLKKNSSVVNVGDAVAQGATIAQSGSSGTTEPHLHISVDKDDKGNTLPLNFSNALKNEWGLKAGKSYVAQP